MGLDDGRNRRRHRSSALRLLGKPIAGYGRQGARGLRAAGHPQRRGPQPRRPSRGRRRSGRRPHGSERAHRHRALEGPRPPSRRDAPHRRPGLLSRWLAAMAPVSLALTRDGARVAVNGTLGQVQVVDAVKGREERTFTNAPEAPGDAMHGELRQSLVFTADGDWLLAPDAHDRGLRMLHVPRGTAHTVIRSDGPFYKAVAIALPASLAALTRPNGFEVWRFTPPAGTAITSSR